ncbi:transcriptional regulator, AraC family [Parafrankia sp. EAN1pec]|uniref:helix-turn-helix domain-containing protein n=1 Tax=Parafrankia sp. (strain EAN1pec) TaxID=298653 RepID=UPI00015D9C7A|nr:transcriptional regulator, AraC family [Frankia sp. EAN1pec]
MATVLDLDHLPAHRRAEVARDAIVALTVTSRFSVHAQHDIRGRIESWIFGEVGLIRTTVNAGQHMIRTARHVRQDSAPPVLSFAQRRHGRAVQEQFGVRRELAAGELYCTDLSSAFEYANAEGGCGQGLQVPLASLGLPGEVVRRGAPNLARSPLYPLVTDHLTALARDAAALERDESAAGVGTATVELVRALLVSAARGPDEPPGTPAEIMLARVRHHVLAHLADSDLNADGIAAAVGVSVRHLYRLCREAEFSLEQWIVRNRLERARGALAARDARGRSIAAIARANGFADPSHFSRRFRAAYGTTPQEWRRHHTPHHTSPPQTPTPEPGSGPAPNPDSRSSRGAGRCVAGE